VDRLHLSDFTFPAESPSPWAGRQGVAFGFLIHHPRGPVIFDTGIGEGWDRFDRLFKPVRYPLRELLASLSVGASDIQLVINCHLHFDHCGNNRLFPKARFLVQAEEFEAAKAPNYTVRDTFDFPGAQIELLRGRTEVLPQLWVLPTPGHTPGHQSAVIETTAGRVVLAGQAIYSPAEFEQPLTGEPTGRPTAWDQGRYDASVQAIRDLQPVAVHFAHDRESWTRPRGPLA
jgi:glyoxylase-like metal-dependent hydrolase (beta-lactamase superfamily II)